MSEPSWYVVYTRPRWEKKVSALLKERKIVHYCPLNKVYRKWSDRMKVVEEPLFKGYVFVQVAEPFKWDVTTVPGILNYVYWLGKPAVVREDEIDTIRKFLREFDNVEVERPGELTGTVLITGGVMMNYKGLVLEVSGNKARVKVDSLGLSITATFDTKDLKPVK